MSGGFWTLSAFFLAPLLLGMALVIFSQRKHIGPMSHVMLMAISYLGVIAVALIALLDQTWVSARVLSILLVICLALGLKGLLLVGAKVFIGYPVQRWWPERQVVAHALRSFRGRTH